MHERHIVFGSNRGIPGETVNVGFEKLLLSIGLVAMMAKKSKRRFTKNIRGA